MILRKGDKVKVLGGKETDIIPDYSWPDVFNKYIGKIFKIASVTSKNNGNYYEVTMYYPNEKTQMSDTFFDFELEPIILDGWDD